MSLIMTATAFADGGAIPAGTRSLVLIVDDPAALDPAAPKMTELMGTYQKAR